MVAFFFQNEAKNATPFFKKLPKSDLNDIYSNEWTVYWIDYLITKNLWKYFSGQFSIYLVYWF